MSGNPYLESLQTRYNGLKANIEGLQNRAVEEDRDLTDDELRSVKEMAEQMNGFAEQIEDLGEIEQRNRKVSELAASVLTSGGGDEQAGEQTRGTALGLTAQERDPGHYTRNSEHSFFGDMYRSRVFGDEVASQRLVDHQRALSTGSNGAGVVPPKWLTGEFEELARQGRALANAVRLIPLGNDPRPLTLPKQTGGTDDVVSEQDAENDEVSGTDAYETDVDTVAPKPTAGKQIVSRQMIDMSNPAIDQLIYGDLVSVYNSKVEAKVGKAVLAVGTALSATEDDFADGTIDAAIAVRKGRHQPANIAAMSVGRYGEFLKLKDESGRPLMPSQGTGQAVNVLGVGSVAVDGIFEGLGIVATDGVPSDDKYAVLRASDVLLFESNMLRFRFEEQAGPESIVLGIWGYTATLVRQGTKAVKTVSVSSDDGGTT